MALQTSVLLAALRDWVKASTSLTNDAVARSHQNGPVAPDGGAAPYIIIDPTKGIKRRGIQPIIVRTAGHRYRVTPWEITAQIDAYRGEPADLLALCEEGLLDPDIYKAAFSDRGISVKTRSDILSSPEDKAGQYERHAFMQIKFRYAPAVQEDLKLLNGVKLAFRFNGALSPEIETLITTDD
jgi:hypothetical protein